MVNESSRDPVRELEEREKIRISIRRARRLVIKILNTLHNSSNKVDQDQAEKYGAMIKWRDKDRFWYLVYQKIQKGYEDIGQPLEHVRSRSADLAQINTAMRAIEYGVEQYDKENEIHNLKIDPLTGFPIRSEFVKDFKEITRDDSYTFFALVVIDTDNLKHVNDNYGHSGGDAYLRDVAVGLRKRISSKGYASPSFARVYRSGPTGDEFFILIASNAVNAQQSKQELLELVQSALADTSKQLDRDKFKINGSKIKTGLSCGVVLFPQSGESDFDTFFRTADQGAFLSKMTATTVENIRHKPEGRLLPNIQRAFDNQKFPKRNGGRWAMTYIDCTGSTADEQQVIKTVVQQAE